MIFGVNSTCIAKSVAFSEPHASVSPFLTFIVKWPSSIVQPSHGPHLVCNPLFHGKSSVKLGRRFWMIARIGSAKSLTQAGIGVSVGVGSGVRVEVTVDVAVGVEVAVFVGVKVIVAVGVTVAKILETTGRLLHPNKKKALTIARAGIAARHLNDRWLFWIVFIGYLMASQIYPKS